MVHQHACLSIEVTLFHAIICDFQGFHSGVIEDSGLGCDHSPSDTA